MRRTLKSYKLDASRQLRGTNKALTVVVHEGGVFGTVVVRPGEFEESTEGVDLVLGGLRKRYNEREGGLTYLAFEYSLVVDRPVNNDVNLC